MVPATTLRDVLSVLELRISLETECAGLAAQRAQPEDLARMRSALDAIEATSRSGGDSVAGRPAVSHRPRPRDRQPLFCRHPHADGQRADSTQPDRFGRHRQGGPEGVCRAGQPGTREHPGSHQRATMQKARALPCACTCPTAASACAARINRSKPPARVLASGARRNKRRHMGRFFIAELVAASEVFASLQTLSATSNM